VNYIKDTKRGRPRPRHTCLCQAEIFKKQLSIYGAFWKVAICITQLDELLGAVAL